MKALKAALDKLSLQELGTAARSLVDASAHREVLERIDMSLVFVDGLLINTLSGEYREVAAADVRPEPALLAQAARDLLPPRDVPPSLLLLLPPADFAATRFELALSGDKLLRSALKLQAHTLVPAYDEDLLLGVHSAGSNEGVALWYPARQANALFEAFADQGLFLAALMPRTLALLHTQTANADEVLLDDDARHSTLVECRQGSVRKLLSIRQVDLQQDSFAAQWQAEIAKAGTVTQHADGAERWRTLRRVVHAQPHYSFFPAGAEQTGRELISHNQRRALNVAAVVVVAALFLPFLYNWAQIQLLESRLDSLREASAVAREAQAAVYQMEDEWGVVAEYPRQDVGRVLLTLNELIDSSLSSFEIDKGVVDISGFAQDPALLIEQLAEREDFYNVSQSSNSSGEQGAGRGQRFGIRFNVSGIDFPAYEAKYPVVEP
ncbi:MAG TPA: hypothetical protein VGE69_08780 [Pseudomonadales bacterium]